MCGFREHGRVREEGESCGEELSMLSHCSSGKLYFPHVAYTAGFQKAPKPWRLSTSLPVNANQMVAQLSNSFLCDAAAICHSLSLKPKKLEVNCFSQIRAEPSDQQSCCCVSPERRFFPETDAG